MAPKQKQRHLRSSTTGDELDQYLGYKPISKFHHETLPTDAEIIGFVIQYIQANSKWNKTFDDAIHVCSKTVHQHWIDRNIYPFNEQRVKRKVKNLVDKFKKLKNYSQDKRTDNWKEKVRAFATENNVLFDIFCEDKKEREALEQQYKVKMQKAEYDYLESMRGDRIGKCEGIDKVWHKNEEKKDTKLKRRRERQMNSTISINTQDDDAIDDDDGEVNISVMTDDSDDEFEVEGTESVTESVTGPSSSNRRCFKDIRNVSFSPVQTRSSSNTVNLSTNQLDSTKDEVQKYVRLAANQVRDEIYEACADLSGYGFSYHDSQVALKVIANRLFGCHWKIPPESRGHVEFTEDEPEDEEELHEFDNNTLPTRKAIRYMLERIEAHSLKLVAQKIVDTKDTDNVVTHATDSTTRKKVGCFAPQGLHINKEEYLPLPTLGMGSETTNNVSASVVTGFKILEAASDHPAEDLYSCVDLHMTDATAHNKGVAVEVANLMRREEPAGQLFCNPHTALGFDRCMKKIINNVEQKMDMSNLINCFVLDINIKQTDTVSLSVINWILNLFGPDLVQQPWNYHSDFVIMLQNMGKVTHLFHMKDSRFGLLSLSCAICIFHWDDFDKFLNTHNYITNKLACLVRDGMEHEYVTVVASVCAAFGVHLVIPFHFKTKGKSDHSTLRDYLTELYDNLMSTTITAGFFDFSTPMFTATSQRMFDGVKSECGIDVLAAVTKCANKHIEECILLANKILPELADTLSMQRGKYYGFGTHEPEFPVFEQAEHVNKGITHNLQLERECGDHDHRLGKKCNISTVSRDNIIKKCTRLRDESSESFRACSAKVMKIKKIKEDWNERQRQLREAGLSAKESAQLAKENRKMKILQWLKSVGGPFTNAEEIAEYMLRDDISESIKQQRLKNEVTYARDSTRSIPAAGILFRIMKTDEVTKKRRTLTAQEFAANLTNVLGKQNSRGEVTMDDFLLALWDN